MRKFFAVYLNEMIKSTHRVLVIVGLISLLLMPAIVFFFSSRNLSYDAGYIADDNENADTIVQMHQDNYDYMLSQFENFDEAEISNDPWWGIELAAAKNRLENAQMIRDTDPALFRLGFIDSVLDTQGWNQGILDVYRQMKSEEDELGDEYSGYDPETFLREASGWTESELAETVNAGAAVLSEGTLDAYIDYIFLGRFDTAWMQGAGRELYRELWDGVQITDEVLRDSQQFRILEQEINEYMNRAQGLEEGSYQGIYGGIEALTPILEEQLGREINVIKYKLENPAYLSANTNISGSYGYVPTATDAFNNSFGIVYLILVIGMLILSASTVSQEVETGTIKALIISPTKRYKIMLAKILALMTVALGLFLIAFMWIQLLSLIFFGSGSLPALVVSLGDSVLAFPPLAAGLIRLLLSFVQLFVFMLVGVTLSTVMRHTAMAVGLSIGIFFVNTIAQMILLASEFSERTRLMPFFHIDFAGRIGASLTDWVFGGFFTNVYPYITPLYSIIYTVILVGLLAWISFDSFTRRDI